MNQRSAFVLVAVGLVLGLGERVADAGLVTWEFAGVVDSVLDVNDLFDGRVTVGTPFSGSFTFDTSTPDSDPDDPTRGFYEGAISTLSGMLGEFPFVFGGPMDVTILNNFGSRPDDAFSFSGSVILADRLVNASYFLRDPTSTMFASDALPLLPPSLDGLSNGFGFNSQLEGIIVSGDITHVVPEPGTLVLLGLGAVLWRRRTRGGTLPAMVHPVQLLPVCALGGGFNSLFMDTGLVQRPYRAATVRKRFLPGDRDSRTSAS